MAFVHGKEVLALVGEFNLSGMFNQTNVSRTRQTVNVTTHGNDDLDWLSGLGEGSISFQGLFDSAAGASDAVLGGTLADGPLRPVTIVYQGGSAIGQRAHMIEGRQTNYSPRSSVQDAVRITSGKQASGGAQAGPVLHHLTAETGTGNFASVDNGASSAFGAVGHLHVTAFTGTNCTVKIQDSADDAAWADLITFTAATGVTYERASATGTVNRYLRASISAGTFSSITFLVAVGRYQL